MHNPTAEAMMKKPTAEAMMHTRILGSRFDLGDKVMCHVHPEGWIEGSIVKRAFEETAYHIQLGYNGELVACPVDSDWYVRKDMPDAANLIVMEANKKDKPRRYPVGEYVYCCGGAISLVRGAGAGPEPRRWKVPVSRAAR